MGERKYRYPSYPDRLSIETKRQNGVSAEEQGEESPQSHPTEEVPYSGEGKAAEARTERESNESHPGFVADTQ